MKRWFIRERETKNTVRYTEQNETDEGAVPTAIGTLYIQKAVVRELGNPKVITVEVKAEG